MLNALNKYRRMRGAPECSLQDITELQRVKFVMKGGKVLKNQITVGGMSTSRQQ